MFEEILEKKEVKEIIQNIKYISINEKNKGVVNYKLLNNQGKILFIFYKALFDFRIIINEKNILMIT